MTVNEAIAQLQFLHNKYGNIPVYFDCPRCNESFTPNIIVTVAAHITGEKK